jgi:hypothetical protein
MNKTQSDFSAQIIKELSSSSDADSWRATNAWRLIETQEVAATRAITPSAKAQQRLEELLDRYKPPVSADCAHLSYLLSTPFRYPPLQYGSRFGSIWTRGIFYAALEKSTACAEAAVYLWLFQSGPVDLGPLKKIRDQRCLFNVKLHSVNAVDLRAIKKPTTLPKIMQKNDWQYSQLVGDCLREAHIDFFYYPSCRIDNGCNIAVISPQAFVEPQPQIQESWQLQLDQETCWFSNRQESFEFCFDDFAIDGVIPHPMTRNSVAR